MGSQVQNDWDTECISRGTRNQFVEWKVSNEEAAYYVVKKLECKCLSGFPANEVDFIGELATPDLGKLNKLKYWRH